MQFFLLGMVLVQGRGVSEAFLKKKNMWVNTITCPGPSWWFQPPLKNISQTGNRLPQIGVNIKNIWNHNLETYSPKICSGKLES